MTARRFRRAFLWGNMAVRISGVLKDGAGKPIQNCTIQLKARRNSTTVVVNTVASENPDEAGRYTMDVEYGQYSVSLLVEGFPPSHAGIITVYEDSKPGTLNDFLGAMTEDDVRPEALRRFELMVEEVARNASAVAQNTAAAKSAGDAGTSAREAATHATDAAGSARAASTSAGQAASSAQSASSSAGTASAKATEASKSAAAAESSKSAAATSAAAAKTSETNAAASNNQQPLQHPPRPRKRQKLPPQPGMRRLQKRRQNHQKRAQPRAPVVPLPRQRRQAIPRTRQKRPRRTLSLLKRQRNRVPPQQQTQKQRLHHLPAPRQQVPGRPQPVPPLPESRQKVPHRLLQQPQRRLAKLLNRPAQQRVLLPQRRHPKRTRKRRKPAQNPQKRLPHRQPVRRRHRHHRRLLQKMRRPDRRQQRGAAPRRHPRKQQRRQAVRRQQLRAKVRRNLQQRALRQRQNGQRILHPPWRLRMQVRRKRG